MTTRITGQVDLDFTVEGEVDTERLKDIKRFIEDKISLLDLGIYNHYVGSGKGTMPDDHETAKLDYLFRHTIPDKGAANE